MEDERSLPLPQGIVSTPLTTPKQVRRHSQLSIVDFVVNFYLLARTLNKRRTPFCTPLPISSPVSDRVPETTESKSHKERSQGFTNFPLIVANTKPEFSKDVLWGAGQSLRLPTVVDSRTLSSGRRGCDGWRPGDRRRTTTPADQLFSPRKPHVILFDIILGSYKETKFFP